MNDDGYTLTEMLAALLMIGLAVGGLAQAVRLLGAAQAAASGRLHEAQTLRAAESALAAMLSGQGPYRSSERSFVGEAQSMSFSCGEPQPCSAALVTSARGTQLHLKRAGAERAFRIPTAHPRFVYEGEAPADRWPPDRPAEVLRAVHLMDAHEEPVFTSRVWTEQPVECAFDSISRDCRGGAR